MALSMEIGAVQNMNVTDTLVKPNSLYVEQKNYEDLATATQSLCAFAINTQLVRLHNGIGNNQVGLLIVG